MWFANQVTLGKPFSLSKSCFFVCKMKTPGHWLGWYPRSCPVLKLQAGCLKTPNLPWTQPLGSTRSLWNVQPSESHSFSVFKMTVNIPVLWLSRVTKRILLGHTDVTVLFSCKILLEATYFLVISWQCANKMVGWKLKDEKSLHIILTVFKSCF